MLYLQTINNQTYIYQRGRKLDQRIGLKLIRAEYGLTYRDLGEIVGCPNRTIENWCLGRSKMPEANLRLLKLWIDSRED